MAGDELAPCRVQEVARQPCRAELLAMGNEMSAKGLIPCLLVLLGALPAQATIIENYSDVDMAYVGEHVFYGPSGTTIAQPFGLRFTDPGGNPISGLTVNFHVNGMLGIPGTVLPPLGAYGSFSGNREVSVITDANGVAKAPEFQIGTIVGEVIAGLWISTPENEQVTEEGYGTAYFHINRQHTGPADPQAPRGGAAAALPATSMLGVIALATLLIFTGFVRSRKSNPARRSP